MGRNMGLNRYSEQKPVYRPGWRAIAMGVIAWAVLLTAGAALYRGISYMIAVGLSG